MIKLFLNFMLLSFSYCAMAQQITLLIDYDYDGSKDNLVLNHETYLLEDSNHRGIIIPSADGFLVNGIKKISNTRFRVSYGSNSPTVIQAYFKADVQKRSWTIDYVTGHDYCQTCMKERERICKLYIRQPPATVALRTDFDGFPFTLFEDKHCRVYK